MDIFIVPEGIAVPVLGIADAAPLLIPEEWMVWGFVSGGQIDTESHFNQQIKAMRKLKVGDRIMLAAIGSATAVALVLAHFVGFIKQ